MTAAERRTHNRPDAGEALGEYATELRWCEHLVFVYPTCGLPAMLKGWVDRGGCAASRRPQKASPASPGSSTSAAFDRDDARIAQAHQRPRSEAGKRLIRRTLRGLCHRCAAAAGSLYGSPPTPMPAARPRPRPHAQLTFAHEALSRGCGTALLACAERCGSRNHGAQTRLRRTAALRHFRSASHRRAAVLQRVRRGHRFRCWRRRPSRRRPQRRRCVRRAPGWRGCCHRRWPRRCGRAPSG